MAWLELKNVKKKYDEKTQVLNGLDLSVSAGERVAVIGPSGCGKITLLHMIGLLDRPDEGTVTLGGQDLLGLSADQAADFRNQQVGFVFQLHHLLPQCTVLENVLVPSLVSKGERTGRAKTLLERVGLADRLDHRPGQLSGGERQRAAVVRALINRPQLLLADEPTGSLNRKGAGELLGLLLELNREENLTLVMVTHSDRLAARLDRALTLENGILSGKPE